MPAREGCPADECPTRRTIRTGRTRVHIILLSKVVDYMYFASSLGLVRIVGRILLPELKQFRNIIAVGYICVISIRHCCQDFMSILSNSCRTVCTVRVVRSYSTAGKTSESTNQATRTETNRRGRVRCTMVHDSLCSSYTFSESTILLVYVFGIFGEIESR